MNSMGSYILNLPECEVVDSSNRGCYGIQIFYIGIIYIKLRVFLKNQHICTFCFD